MAVLVYSVCLLAVFVPSLAQERDLFATAELYGATNFTDLLTKVGLDSELKSSANNITVFAPTVRAFDDLDPVALALLESDTALLTTDLSYHIVDGFVVVSELSNDQLIPSSSGAALRFNRYNNNGIIKTTFSGSETRLSDLRSTNGLLFLMDSVIFPVPSGSALDYVNAEASLSTLLLLLTQSGLSTLFTEPNLTLFAPTNTAFANLPAGELDRLLSNPTLLQDVLRYHVINTGTYYSAGLYQGQQLAPANGGQLSVTENNGVFVNGNKLSVLDITVSNGVVHIIDSVLIPPPSHV